MKFLRFFAVLIMTLCFTNMSRATEQHVFKVLAIIFEYNDAPVFVDPNDHEPSHQINQQNILRILFSRDPQVVSVNNIYKNATYDKIRFAGDVTPLLHIDKNHPGARPGDKSGCSSDSDYVDSRGVRQNGFRTDANEVVLNQVHKKISDYDIVIYIYPGDDRDGKGGKPCGGASEVRPAGGKAYIKIGRDVGVATEARVGTYAHEIGHAFHLNHAGSLHCGQSDEYLNGPRCASSSLSDPTDIMGAGGVFNPSLPSLYGMNALHRLQLNLIPPSQREKVEMSGSYLLGDLNSGANLPKVLILPKRDTPGSFYTLQYNKSLGVLAVSAGPDHRTIIHNSKNALFSPGQGISDPVNGITIRLKKIDSAKVLLDITFVTKP